MDKCSYDSQTSDTVLSEVIVPYASYVAIGVLVVFLLVVIISKIILSADTKTNKSDLVLFNNSNNKRLESLVSRQGSNLAAVQNIHAAVALGLMDPPPNYQPANTKSNETLNNIKHENLDDFKETNKKFKKMGNF